MIIFNDDMTPLDRVDADDVLSVLNMCGNERPPRPSDDAGCDINSRPLAMVYSPKQKWQNIYSPEEAMEHGTLFADLYFPWLAGEKGKR